MDENTKKNIDFSSVLNEAIENPNEFARTVSDVCRQRGLNLPSWISYPEVENADWLNNIIKKFWPFLGIFVKDLLTNKIQESIQKSHDLLKNFRFTNVDLGERTPRIVSITVPDDKYTQKDQIIIDVQFIYDGDSNLGVGVKFLEAGVRDVHLQGLLRIELKPLLAKLPLIGAISLGFVKDPTIKFDLTELANLLDFPGLNCIVRSCVADSVRSFFVLPERYIRKFSDDVDVSLLRFPLPKGMIRIHVIEAENLVAEDLFGKTSDPFVKIKVEGADSVVGEGNEFQTKVIENTVNPKWNETFDVLVRELLYGNVECNIYDDDGAVLKADYLGRIVISVKSIFDYGVLDEKIQLFDTESGKVHLRFEWFDLSTDPGPLEQKEMESVDHSSNRALLSIYVDRANYLPKIKENTKNPNPYLKIHLPEIEAFDTKVVNDTSNPVWEENFRVFLKQPSSAEAKFVIQDENSDQSLGNLAFSVKDLFGATNMTLEKNFLLQNSSEKAFLRLRMSLRSLKAKPQTLITSSNEKLISVSSRNNRAVREDTTGKEDK